MRPFRNADATFTERSALFGAANQALGARPHIPIPHKPIMAYWGCRSRHGAPMVAPARQRRNGLEQRCARADNPTSRHVKAPCARLPCRCRTLMIRAGRMESARRDVPDRLHAARTRRCGWCRCRDAGPGAQSSFAATMAKVASVTADWMPTTHRRMPSSERTASMRAPSACSVPARSAFVATRSSPWAMAVAMASAARRSTPAASIPGRRRAG